MKIDKIKEKLNNLVGGIAEKAIFTGEVPRFWQLYLDAGDEIEKEVDTCATSQCLSILANAQYDNSQLISEAVASVVRLRNEQGSWPSAITVEELIDPAKRWKGDIAIGDNCFALTALVDAGFLCDNFCYGSQLSKDFNSLYNRIKYVFQAVDWLLKNKAKDNLGWYYTDEITDDHGSVTLTTLNVLQVFSRIINCLKSCGISPLLSQEQKQECTEYELKLTTELTNIINVLIDPKNIFEDIGNDWKAVRTSLGSSEPSIIHTCKLLNLILYNQRFNKLNIYQDVNDIAKYIIDNTREQDVFNAGCESFYFEYYDLHKITPLNKPWRPIKVDHENFAEGIALYTLINIQLNGMTVQNDIIESMLNSLISLMDNIAPNFYRCRSQRGAKNNCWYPVYACYEAYLAINRYLELYKLGINSSQCDEDNKEELKKEINEYIQKLTTFSSDTKMVKKPQYYEKAREDIARAINTCNSALRQESVKQMRKLFQEAKDIISAENIDLNEKPQ